MWFGVIFIRHGLYQDGVFKFTVYIPDNYPDGDCPVSKASRLPAFAGSEEDVKSLKDSLVLFLSSFYDFSFPKCFVCAVVFGGDFCALLRLLPRQPLPLVSLVSLLRVCDGGWLCIRPCCATAEQTVPALRLQN